MFKHLVAATVVFGTLASGHAATIDFEPSTLLTTADTLGNGTPLPGLAAAWISNRYGDQPGLLDVTYRYFNSNGVLSSSLQPWSTGYDELVNTAWFGAQGGSDYAQVSLASVNGSVVDLSGFRLGAWQSGIRNETVRVFEIGQATPVYDFTGGIGANNLSSLFSFSNLQSTSGYVIQWTNPWWIAVDNIVVSASQAAVVPEPSAVALILGGLATLGALRARARRAA